MIRKLSKVFIFLLNLSIFAFLSVIIFRVLWGWFGQEYVFGNQAVGSDYFNALTYQVYFSKYNPNPISGWLPFWHEGSPIIGGYSALPFYLASYSSKLYEAAMAMNIFSVGSLALFFISSLLLFWQVSRNWLIAASLTVVAMTTQASYYQLTVGGFIASAATQWYLPLALYFLFKFHESSKTAPLILSALVVGISALSHGPTSLLVIFLPMVAMLAVLPQVPKSLDHKIKSILLFAIVSLSVGLTGFYTMITKTFLGSGSGGCASPECWGLYPKHLILWLTPTTPTLAAAFFVVSAIAKILKRRPDFSLVWTILVGFLVLFLYSLAAYLKLINGLANVIFPTRTFWAVNLFILLIAASLFYSFRKSLGLISYFVASLTFLIILLTTLTHPFQIKTDAPNTVPRDINLYITAKVPKQLSEIVPDWVLNSDKQSFSTNQNWRADILNSSVYQWFNTISEIPITRGYSNQSALAVHQNWQYFLQFATRDVSQNLDPELVENRALFLLDAYGVKFFDNAFAPYPQSLTDNPKYIKNKDIYVDNGSTNNLKNIQWYQLSDDITTPIVSPSGTFPILFVGDDKGYENFIRTIAMTNLSSRVLIPVHGPKSPNKITKTDLDIFPAIMLYQYSGGNLDRFADYVQKGGKIFIDTGPAKELNYDKTPEIIPLESLEVKTVSGPSDWQKAAPDIVENIDTQKFEELSYENGPWRITTSDKQTKPWAKEFLSYQNQPVLAGGQLGNGYVIWSGLNLPFHIVDNNNLEEARLFKNIITKLTQSQDGPTATFTVQRPRPESISIQANNINGIYFKENYDPGWQAKTDGQKLKVYKAGLDFMYIPIPKANADKLTVNLSYKGSLISWFLFWQTLTSTVLIILILLSPRRLLRLLTKITDSAKTRLTKRVASALEDE